LKLKTFHEMFPIWLPSVRSCLFSIWHRLTLF
jgi:hypothetical protein